MTDQSTERVKALYVLQMILASFLFTFLKQNCHWHFMKGCMDDFSPSFGLFSFATKFLNSRSRSGEKKLIRVPPMLLGKENECLGVIMFFSKIPSSVYKCLREDSFRYRNWQTLLGSNEEKSIIFWSFWPNLGPNSRKLLIYFYPLVWWELG